MGTVPLYTKKHLAVDLVQGAPIFPPTPFPKRVTHPRDSMLNGQPFSILAERWRLQNPDPYHLHTITPQCTGGASTKHGHLQMSTSIMSVPSVASAPHPVLGWTGIGAGKEQTNGVFSR